MKTNPDWNLLTKYINNECSEEEIIHFEQWLSISNENREYFNQIKEAWGTYGVNHASFSPDKKEAWQKINLAMGENKSKTRQLVIWSISIAASLLLLAGLYSIFKPDVLKIENQELVSVVTEKTSDSRMLVLPDSSVVWLNKSTTIKYPPKFAQNERRVILSGEAYFEVSKNAKRPFIIEAGNTETKVIGTSFNLRAYENENEVKIVVNSGKVEFGAKNENSKKVILTKNFAALYDKNSTNLQKTDSYDINYQSWKTGILSFYNANLLDVCNTIENYYNKKIIIESPQLERLKFSATFNNQELEEVVKLIAQTLDIDFQLKNDSVLLLKK
jgi:transmembrane sensor